MRHTQAIILAAVLLAGIVSGGCTRIHSAEELTKDTRPETTPVFTDAPKLEFSADGVDPYANVIAYYVEQYQKDLESPSVPINGAELTLFGAAGKRLSDNEIDQLVRGGVTPIETVGGVSSPVRGITTKTSSGGAADTTWREPFYRCI